MLLRLRLDMLSIYDRSVFLTRSSVISLCADISRKSKRAKLPALSRKALNTVVVLGAWVIANATFLKVLQYIRKQDLRSNHEGPCLKP